jgi:hypothetical protein
MWRREFAFGSFQREVYLELCKKAAIPNVLLIAAWMLIKWDQRNFNCLNLANKNVIAELHITSITWDMFE